MKKVFTAMFLPLVAVTLMVTGCQNSKVSRLKAEIMRVNDQCPVDMGMMGSLTKVDFDDDNNLIVFEYTIDEEALDTDVDALVQEDDYEMGKLWLGQAFQSGDGKEFADLIIDAGVGVRAELKGTRSWKTATIVIPADEIQAIRDNPISDDERNARMISGLVESNRSQCPLEVDEGMIMVDVIDDGKNVVFVYDVDEDVYDIDEMDSNYLSMKNEMKKLFHTDAMFKAIGAQLSGAGYGMIYRYKGATTGKYVDIKLTASELR